MSKTIPFDEEKYLDFSNDASASIFGYLFQAKAALWLFLNNIREAESVKVETKNQDIEIHYSSGSVDYAQAKAQQSYSTEANEKQKLKLALISLARTKVNDNDKLIYICNLSNPLFVSGDLQLRMNLIKYSDLTPEQKKNVDESIDEIIKSFNKDLKSKQERKEIENQYKNKLSIRKLKTMKNLVKRLDKNKLVFTSIYPCSEIDENALIDNLELVFSKLDIHVDKWQLYKIYNDWTMMLTVAEEKRDIAENQSKKVVNKSSFAWSIASKLLESTFNYDNLVDRKILREISSYQKDIVQKQIEAGLFDDVGWPICNKVINDYDEFNKAHHGTFDRDFISEKWEDYLDDFSLIDLEDDVREALTRYKIYQIISKHINITDIQRKVGLPHEN